MIFIRKFRGVPLSVHWSVPAVCLFFLGLGWSAKVTAALAILSYVAFLMIHELGHQLVAQRLGCRVTAIEVYPLHALCRHDLPYSELHHALIAAGGPAAQFAVAVPAAALAYAASRPPSRHCKRQ